MPHIVILGTSLDPDSRSQILAREVLARVVADGHATAEVIDLRDLDLPESGRAGAHDHPTVRDLRRRMASATHLVFAVAIYNYDVSAAAKNLIELTGGELKDRIVGFVCSAGGKASYMSVMAFASSLILDFRVWMVPRYVYALSSDFAEGALHNREIHQRLDEFVIQLLNGPGGRLGA